MTVFSISDVENITGIRAHTLRAWEQRYGLIEPRRDANNVRFYTDDDLCELYNIALLNRSGQRISKIAALSTQQRSRQVAEVASLNISEEVELDALSLCAVEADPDRFSLILNIHIEQRGFEETMIELVYPMLEKLGLLFFTGSVRAIQESLIAGLIRQKILAATDRLPDDTDPDLPVFALFLPEGERQELSTLFVQYLLRKRGFSVLYLGTNVTPRDLADLELVRSIDYYLTILSSTYVSRPVEDLVRDMLESCPDSLLLLSGYQPSLQNLSHLPRVRTAGGLSEMIAFMDRLSRREDPSTALVR